MFERRTANTITNILLIVATGLLLVLLWEMRSLLLILMIAVVIAATIAPLVDRAERKKLPRWLAVIIVYLTLIGIAIGAGVLIGPTVIDQIQRLALNLPIYLENVRSILENWIIIFYDRQPELIGQLLDPEILTNGIIGSSQQLLLRSYGITKGILGGILSLILALVFSGYMIADSKNLVEGLVQLFPYPWNERLEAQIVPASQRMGGYIQGRIGVSAILGIAISVGLGFLGLSDFALGLGAIAGFTDLIPFFGPILGAIPALIVAISQGGWTFLWVLLLFAIVQNLETYVLDPLLVGSSVRVHPLYQLLAVLGGTQVLGIIGALIVPPWVAGAAVLLENLYLQPKRIAEEQSVIITTTGEDLTVAKSSSSSLSIKP